MIFVSPCELLPGFMKTFVKNRFWLARRVILAEKEPEMNEPSSGLIFFRIARNKTSGRR